MPSRVKKYRENICRSFGCRQVAKVLRKLRVKKVPLWKKKIKKLDRSPTKRYVFKLRKQLLRVDFVF